MEPDRRSLDGQFRTVDIGAGQWDPARRRLSVRGQNVKLPWRVTECLKTLIEAQGAAVTKEDLERRIWNGTLVDGSSLAQCISAVRRALDPAGDGESHIETLPRVGYRWAAPILPALALPAEAPDAAPVRRLPRFAYFAAIVALAAAVVYGLQFQARMAKTKMALELTQEGLKLIRRSNTAHGAKAAPLFREALDLVPNFGLALAGLAEGSARYGWVASGAASDLARHSIRAEPGCGECQAIAGYIFMTREWRWKESGDLLASSVKLEPGKIQLRCWYATWLTIHGRFDEAAGQAESAIRIDPALPAAHSTLAMVRYFQGYFDEAIEAGQKSVAIDANHQPGYAWLYRTYMTTGQDVDALVARAHAVAIWAGLPYERYTDYSTPFQELYRKGGRKEIVRQWNAVFSQGNPLKIHRYDRANWFAWIGEYDNAQEELQAAVDARPYHVIFTAVDPAFAALRSNPRFREVVRRIGLTPL